MRRTASILRGPGSNSFLFGSPGTLSGRMQTDKDSAGGSWRAGLRLKFTVSRAQQGRSPNASLHTRAVSPAPPPRPVPRWLLSLSHGRGEQGAGELLCDLPGPAQGHRAKDIEWETLPWGGTWPLSCLYDANGPGHAFQQRPGSASWYPRSLAGPPQMPS